MTQNTTHSKAMQTVISAKHVTAFGLWLLAMFGVLQLHRYPDIFTHGICGPWGCGPPVSALVSYHGFWCLLIFPTAAILRTYWCPTAVRILGRCMCLLGVAGVASLLLFEGLNNSAAEAYPWRWSLFRIVTFVDIPLVQITLAGFWMKQTSRQASNCEVTESSESRSATNCTTQA